MHNSTDITDMIPVSEKNCHGLKRPVSIEECYGNIDCNEESYWVVEEWTEVFII